ncbi:MAG: DUF2252 family protein [Polyangiaceae bacterium]|jgi:hypothetical protein|nr:DUF2252 family protein [Polyangiaceae bacterium]
MTMIPMQEDDFRPARELTRAFFRATNPHLSHEEFEAKWQKSFDSPLRFFRSFPQAYYLDLTCFQEDHVPGRVLWCFGDLHPENFGYLTFKQGLRYVFNDLDDSGPGLVALDALRYFTALQLTNNDRHETNELIDFYRDVMRDPSRGTRLPASMAPDPIALREKELRRYVTQEGLFLLGGDSRLGNLAEEEGKVLLHAFSQHPWLSTLKPLDLAERDRPHGGSGGLRRFWVLVRQPPERDEAFDILEFKELTKAAITWGRQFTLLEDRVEHAKREVWRGLDTQDHETIILGRSEFLVRSRLGRSSFDIDDLKKKERRAVFEAQISLMAAHHRRAFEAHEYQDLDDWLQLSVRVLARRYRELFERLR